MFPTVCAIRNQFELPLKPCTAQLSFKTCWTHSDSWNSLVPGCIIRPGIRDDSSFTGFESLAKLRKVKERLSRVLWDALSPE